jgi:cytidine deaminase
VTARTTPFPKDARRAARTATLLAQCGVAFGDALAELLVGPGRDARHPAAVVGPHGVAELVAGFGLDTPEEAAILALETAQALASPPVSGYRVGAVGLVPEGGMLLGGNLEWPGASIWQTVHGEGFVTLLARARATRITTLITSQARPCAHCRQVLAEMDGADELVLADPAGRRLRLADVYPWPFEPADLDADPARPGDDAFPFLGLSPGDTDAPQAIASALVAAGRRSHAPYSGCAAACVLVMADGTLHAGSVLESVAFNPTIGPVQDALVGLAAAGRSGADVLEAWLGVGRDAAVGHERMARDLLAAAAPRAAVHVRYWT